MKSIFVILLLSIGFQANAGLITISVDKSNIIEGDSFEVTLTGSNFTPFDYLELDFLFDTDMYAFEENSLTSDLPLIDELFPGEGLRASLINGSGLFFDFYQWDEFVAPQSSFLLANFELTATSHGVGLFSIANEYFSHAINGDVVVDASTTKTQQVRNVPVSVPEPSIAFLLLFGMAVAFYKRSPKKFGLRNNYL